MKLITSDLWDFLEQDDVGKMLENLSNYDSNYDEGDYDLEDDDWNSNFKELQDIGKRLNKGSKGNKVRVYAEEFIFIEDINSDVSDVKSIRDKDLDKAYDSDIQLETKRFSIKSIINKDKQSLLLNPK